MKFGLLLDIALGMAGFVMMNRWSKCKAWFCSMGVWDRKFEMPNGNVKCRFFRMSAFSAMCF
jgi:hypothetical protein